MKWWVLGAYGAVFGWSLLAAFVPPLGFACGVLAMTGLYLAHRRYAC